MTPWVKRLLIANVGVFLLQLAYPELTSLLAFVPARVLSAPWTPLTYMFIHGGFWHILFNMIVLYFFGPRVEERLGSNRFITLYLISGFTGALFSVFTPDVAILGASAAVFGVELAYARFWPLDRVYIYGVLPIQMRWLVVITVVMSIFGLGGFEPGVAHLAHLGGLVGAAIYLYVISRSRARPKKSGPVRAEVRQPTPPRGDDMKRWATIPRGELHEINRHEVDRLLDKISLKGINSLTPSERAALDRFSKQKS
ncbi:MAG TPA: rhomboid family intramembrane serine protease [Gemmatimonadaceae bacterium]|jgi:membrane associated rhomboid family serine protease|nr:rhomboid family intramembrane serine protease [Gemmatimonadaceae bacterium]